MWRHYVYVHRRASDGRVFYVGKGSHPDRMSERASRNKRWHATAAKHGIVAEHVLSFETDALAQQCERDLIAWYGRANLVNMTDGGDGCAGIVMSEQARRKLSEHAKKPRSEAWVKSIRAARKNGGNGGVVKKGDKLPESWRRSLAAAKMGAMNPMHGRTGESHPRSRKVRDAATGAVYPSITAAAKSLGLSVGLMHNMLTGVNRNTTSLEFA